MIIVFDMDDTLYPEVEFVKSGLRSVAKLVSSQSNLSINEVYEFMWKEFVQNGSGKIFNAIIEKYSLNIELLDLINHYRNHIPDISLSVASENVLKGFKERGISLGLITDGPVQTQKNKYAALGLGRYIDFPIFSGEMGTSKPDSLLFNTMMTKFNNENKFWYIADNPKKDFIAPEQLGWNYIRIKIKNGIYRNIEFRGEMEVEEISQIFSLIDP